MPSEPGFGGMIPIFDFFIEDLTETADFAAILLAFSKILLYNRHKLETVPADLQ